MAKKARAVVAGLLALCLFAGCADDGDVLGGAAPEPSTGVAAVPAVLDVENVRIESLAGGSGTPFNARAEEIDEYGYVERELLMTGTANVYAGAATGPPRVAEEAVPYTTRILVRAPANSADFSGRVVVEPFNTSGRADSDVAWTFIESRILEAGDAWIGVTERNVSVDALTEFDEARYRRVELSTNALAWDILGQLGALLKTNGPDSPLRELAVERLYMAGYSQSGIEVSTYASAFHAALRTADGSGVYDGYLVMARSASLTPLDSGPADAPDFERAPIGAVDVPLIDLETETDVQGFIDPAYTNPSGASVRRADSDGPSDYFRLYEIAGSAHAVEEECNGEPTTFPVPFFAHAAYQHLVDWVERGVAPPRADRIATSRIATVTEVRRDDVGNAEGGVRSPYVDVPLARYDPSDTPGLTCKLSGSETLLDRATLNERYGDVDGYLAAFRDSLSAAVARGSLLVDDVPDILAGARRSAERAFGR